MSNLQFNFFERDAVSVAKDLLGCFFVHKTQNGNIRGKIIETEAYGDETDFASHARFGKTNRNAVMFGSPGTLYVYKIYGIFDLTNIVCGKEGTAGAILIRAVEIVEGQNLALTNLANHRYLKKYYSNVIARSDLATKQSISKDKIATPSARNDNTGNPASGPGKLSAAFSIDRSLTGIDTTKSKTIYITSKDPNDFFEIVETTRIGVDYAKDSKDLPWRFYIKDSPFVSKK